MSDYVTANVTADAVRTSISAYSRRDPYTVKRMTNVCGYHGYWY